MKHISKTETEAYIAEVELNQALSRTWQPGKEYGLTEYVRPNIANGYEYEATAAGQSGTIEPKWPTTVGNAVADGSVTWTARAFGPNGRDTISSVNIDAPAGITVSAPNTVGTEVSFTISGGTKDETYEISVEVTTGSGEVIEEKIRVTIYDD